MMNLLMKKFKLACLSAWLLCSSHALHAQPYPVTDADAIEQSTQHLLFNFLKQQQYKNILEEKQDMEHHYTALLSLQQQVIQQLKQAQSVQDLRWADLSKSIYLADELINGIRAPGVEFDFQIKHPLLEQSHDQIYKKLFIAGSGDPLPADMDEWKQAISVSNELMISFSKVAAGRKAYAAVAFQYLAEDLTQKAAEMNALLKQPQRLSRPGFSMTEAERLQLQADAKGLLERATVMMERSDHLLLEVARTPTARQQAYQKQLQLKRGELGRVGVFSK